MKITEKINFRQPKYMLPLIIYVPLLLCGYLFMRLFSTEKAEVDTAETTEYFNDKLPAANIKGDGIGDKYTNMVNDFGKIKDLSAVENIERGGEDIKEEYVSQYQDAELVAVDQSSKEGQESLERLIQMQEQIRQQQAKDTQFMDDRTEGNSSEEEQTLANLRQALADARQEGLRQMSGIQTPPSDAKNESVSPPARSEEDVSGTLTINRDAVSEIPDEAPAEEVVKKQEITSSFFHTISADEPEKKLIKAIVDEDIKAVDGSRVRLRLLDDIDIGDRTIPRGFYLYCTMSGFGQQRVKGTVKSILINDELVKVNLTIYDTDGLEGLYVPNSSFREAAKDIASGAVSQNMNMANGTSTNTLAGWSMQAIQNAYQKTTNAISKHIKKNKVNIKYGTQVYLINSKENRSKQ